jgi:GH15 family glucan-1,4-alpha-glucosidase
MMIDRNIIIKNQLLSVEMSDSLKIDRVRIYDDKKAFLSGGRPFSQIGIWVNGKFSWLHSSEWKYRTNLFSHSSFISSEGINEELGIKVKVEEILHPNRLLFMRQIYVSNEGVEKKKVRLFFYQNVTDGQEEEQDTAFFSPKERVMLHHKKDWCWLFNGCFNDFGVQQYSAFSSSKVKKSAQHGIDVQSGNLFFNPIAKGNVTSVISIEGELLPYENKFAHYWFTAGTNRCELLDLNAQILDLGPRPYISMLEGKSYEKNLQPFDKVVPIRHLHI